jgi:hypothetical protein
MGWLDGFICAFDVEWAVKKAPKSETDRRRRRRAKNSDSHQQKMA